MRKPLPVLVTACVVAVVALLVVGLTQRTSLAFTLGVFPATPAAELNPGQRVCQVPIAVPSGAEFDRIVVKLGTFGKPGPELEASVADSTGRVISRGTLRGGYADVAQSGEQAIAVDEVPENSDVDVCLRNRGNVKVAVFGNADAASRTSTAWKDNEPTGNDLTLVFERSPRSVASLFGAMAERASLFKLSWAGAWMFWLLGALVLLAVPALLVRAVRGLEE